MNGITYSQGDIRIRAIAELYSSLGIRRDASDDYQKAQDGRDLPLVNGAYYRLVSGRVQVIDPNNSISDELITNINHYCQDG